MYVIKIIILCALIQLGSVIIHGKKYKKLYVLAGGILIVHTLFSFPPLSMDVADLWIAESEYVQTYEIKPVFEQKVSETIKNNLFDNLNLSADVDVFVSEDYTSLKVDVICKNKDIDISLVEEYVKKTFLNEKDEVRVVCEYN